MQRYPSKISLAETSASSRTMNTNNTHAIIQTDGTGKEAMKYILLPVKNLLDFGRPLKTNDVVTYKLDMKGRRTQRGKIILFGCEDECTEQLQILSAIADEDNINVSGTCYVNDLSELQLNESAAHGHFITEDANGSGNGSHARDKEIKTNRTSKSDTVSSKRQRITEHDNNEPDLNRNLSIQCASSNNIHSTPTSSQRGSRHKGSESEQASVTRPGPLSMATNKFGSDHNGGSQKTIDQMLKKKVIVGTLPSTKSSITFDAPTEPTPSKNCNTTTPQSARTREGMVTPLQSCSRNSQQKASSHSQEYAFATRRCDENDDEENEARCQKDIDPNVADKDYIIKMYNKLQQQNSELQAKYDKLVIAYQHLKENSLPMPNEFVRQWLVHLGKLLGPKSSTKSTEKIADELGIDSSSLLMSCVRNTPSNTTRQIVKLLYTPEERKRKRGKDVPQAKRQLIKEFVEQEHGPIERRPFREAINGVFRSEIHTDKKKSEAPMANKMHFVNRKSNDASIDLTMQAGDCERSVHDESWDEDDF